MKIYREPLFHFLLLGLAVFAWFRYVTPTEELARDDSQVVIDASDIERLVAQFQKSWQRAPTLTELEGMQETLLREEILVREARALGLDQNDLIVRNRLAQKMEFLTTSLSQSVEPEDSVLRDHLASNPERFIEQGKAGFIQISLGQNADAEFASDAIQALNSGADPGDYGTSSLLPAALSLTSAAQIDSTFGRGFFEALQTMPIGQWAGPVQSGYGWHIVYLEDWQEPQIPAFEGIKDEVLFDWRRDFTSELAEAQFEALKAKYEVEALSSDQLAERLTP